MPIDPAAPLTQAMTQTGDRRADGARGADPVRDGDQLRRRRHRARGSPRSTAGAACARALTRCSGTRADLRDRRRPRRLGAGTAARSGRLHDHDDVSLRVRQRPGHGPPDHRHRHHEGRTRQRDRRSRRTPGSRSPSSPTATPAPRSIEQMLAYLPDHADAEPPHSPTTDPIDRSCPEAGELIPPVVDRQLRRPPRRRGDRRRRLAARDSAPGGPATSSPRSRPSAGDRSASSPTSR